MCTWHVRVQVHRSLFMHLTNYSVNKDSAKFVPNEDADADDQARNFCF